MHINNELQEKKIWSTSVLETCLGHTKFTFWRIFRETENCIEIAVLVWGDTPDTETYFNREP